MSGALAVAEARDLVSELLPELPDYIEQKLGTLSDDESRINARVFSSEEKAAFVRAFVANRGAFLRSCEVLNADPATVYSHLNRDHEWMAALKTAKLSLGETLQSHLHDLAMKPNGTLATTILLKNRYFPKVYKDSASQIINVGVSVNLRAPSST